MPEFILGLNRALHRARLQEAERELQRFFANLDAMWRGEDYEETVLYC